MTTLASEVDWGNVPAWLAAVLTGGSLLLGFSILIKDRRGKRIAQAQRILVSLEVREPKTVVSEPVALTVAYIRVANTSDQPIFNVKALLLLDLPTRTWRIRPKYRQPPNTTLKLDPPALFGVTVEEYPAVLNGQTSIRYVLEGLKIPLSDTYTPHLRFIDGNGTRWDRTPTSLTPYKTHRRLEYSKWHSVLTVVLFPIDLIISVIVFIAVAFLATFGELNKRLKRR